MSLQLVLMVSVGIALLACARRTEARVRLNSIRTVILTEGHALPMNRSAWGPDMDLTVSGKIICGSYRIEKTFNTIKPKQREKTPSRWRDEP